MKINGKVHCFFEQSGTFKREFIKLGIPAEDYDIQNNFGETDHVIDLFAEIEKAYNGKPSLWDNITTDDLIMAFFPCIYFCEKSQVAMTWDCVNYRKLSIKQKSDKILERSANREKFFRLATMMLTTAKVRGLRLIMENPWSPVGFLKNNFIIPPALVDMNRQRRGDYFRKPTAFWFVNCKPTHGQTFMAPKERKTVAHSKASPLGGGVCSEERSMISPDYSRNFICDFILGKEQQNSQLTLF
jgi:hypothetical protein